MVSQVCYHSYHYFPSITNVDLNRQLAVILLAILHRVGASSHVTRWAVTPMIGDEDPSNAAAAAAAASSPISPASTSVNGGDISTNGDSSPSANEISSPPTPASQTDRRPSIAPSSERRPSMAQLVLSTPQLVKHILKVMDLVRQTMTVLCIAPEKGELRQQAARELTASLEQIEIVLRDVTGNYPR
jgi:hypothetical protein